MAKSKELSLAVCAEVAQQCAGFNLRRASRAVTQAFDDVFSEVGLRSTQFIVLLMAAVQDSPSIAQLARELVLDPSTLTRNLRPLINQDLIQLTSAGGRAKQVRLTPTGRTVLREAIELWKDAQAEFVDEFGQDRWNRLRKELSAVLDAVGTTV